jgi:hypothetical protein
LASFRQFFWRLTTLLFGCVLADMNNSKFALLVAETHRKDASREWSEPWKNLRLNWPRALPPAEEKYRLTENVWLLHLDSGLPVLAELIKTMKDYSIPIRVLFFEDAPDWIKHPPDAEAKPS